MLHYRVVQTEARTGSFFNLNIAKTFLCYRQSCTKLATFIANYELFQIEASTVFSIITTLNNVIIIIIVFMIDR